VLVLSQVAGVELEPTEGIRIINFITPEVNPFYKIV
jgi:hypothetical protein